MYLLYIWKIITDEFIDYFVHEYSNWSFFMAEIIADNDMGAADGLIIGVFSPDGNRFYFPGLLMLLQEFPLSRLWPFSWLL